MSFDLSKMKEVKTIIKYTLLKFVDTNSEGNEEIVKVLRYPSGEEIQAPIYARDMTSSIDHYYYYYYAGWKNSNNEIVANSNNNTILVPELNTTYYANLESIGIPKIAKVLMTGPETTDQTMALAFEITADYNVFLGSANYYDYNIVTTCTNSQFINWRKTVVTFKIENYEYSLGVTERLSPEFTLYRDSQLTEEIGKVIIDIDIESSSQSTGD